MTLDPLLLDLLACPVDKQALLYLPAEGLLYNPRLRRGYRVDGGIPLLLPDQGEPVAGERHAELLARARGAGQAAATLRVRVADLLAGRDSDGRDDLEHPEAAAWPA